jgi:hypothetical protein
MAMSAFLISSELFQSMSSNLASVVIGQHHHAFVVRAVDYRTVRLDAKKVDDDHR